SAIEFVATHGRDFAMAYELDWRDGVWRHIEKPVPDVPPIELTVDALEEAMQSFAAGDPEATLSEAHIARERARYFAEAHQAAEALRARTAREPPRVCPTIGDPDIDELAWFDFVHTCGP